MKRVTGRAFLRWCLKHGHQDVVAKDVKRLLRRRERHLNWKQREIPEEFVNDRRWYYRNVYLKSEHWKQLRARKLKASPVCEIPGCGSKYRVEPHHLRYKNLYDVELEDLQTLCRRHHRLEHERLDREKQILATKGFLEDVPQTSKRPP